MDSKLKKILFLDIDGVLNNHDTFKKSLGRHQTNKLIDPYMALLLHRIIEATGCEVVLSSSWRHFNKGQPVKEAGIPFIDITGDCCSGVRGVEINDWINVTLPYEVRSDPSQFRYAILDDDSDMLLSQKDNFFQTTFEDGLTDDIAKLVIEHLNK